MKKMTINGVEFCNFGSNNYSGGMDLITCYPMPENMVEEVLQGKYPGVFLNPSAPCREEFYGFFGTPEQYKEVCKEQRECQISKACIEKAGGFENAREMPIKEWRKIQAQCRAEYKDWWNK